MVTFTFDILNYFISYPSWGKLIFCVLPVVCLLQKADHFFEHLLKSLWTLQTTSNHWGLFICDLTEKRNETYLPCFSNNCRQYPLPCVRQKCSSCPFTQDDLNWNTKYSLKVYLQSYQSAPHVCALKEQAHLNMKVHELNIQVLPFLIHSRSGGEHF